MKRNTDLMIIGGLLCVQGAGSLVAAAAGGSWGLLAVAERWWAVPGWVPYAVLAAGVGLAVTGWARQRRRTA